MLALNAAAVEAVEKRSIGPGSRGRTRRRPTAQLLGELGLVGSPIGNFRCDPTSLFRSYFSAPNAPSERKPSKSSIKQKYLGALRRKPQLGWPLGLRHRRIRHYGADFFLDCSQTVSGNALYTYPPLGSFPVTLHARSKETSEGVERLRAIIIDCR